MDMFLLKNYCFLEGERIITSFHGIINQNFAPTIGIIYLTNYRLFINGQLIQSSTGSAGFYGNVRQQLPALIKEKIKSSLNQSIETRIRNFGDQYPVLSIHGFERKNKSFLYNFNVELQKKKKTKNLSIALEITPKREKQESKNDFKVK